MQSAGVSLISAVIPRIDTLVCIIDMFTEDATRHPAIRSAALCGLNILNKYYEKSDESFMYWIAMALDPRFKLEYFIKFHQGALANRLDRHGQRHHLPGLPGRLS